MRPFFIALTLSLLSNFVFGQWNTKHIDLDDFRFINGIIVKQGTSSINETDVSSLSPGVYFLTMTDKNSWFTSRFVKIDN